MKKLSKRDVLREAVRAYRDNRPIDFRGRRVPKWARLVLEQELLHAGLD